MLPTRRESHAEDVPLKYQGTHS
eukprot:COSAG02_NODE_4653_length_5132_cov_2.022651_9_plen_22_part_01